MTMNVKQFTNASSTQSLKYLERYFLRENRPPARSVFCYSIYFGLSRGCSRIANLISSFGSDACGLADVYVILVSADDKGSHNSYTIT